MPPTQTSAGRSLRKRMGIETGMGHKEGVWVDGDTLSLDLGDHYVGMFIV